MRVACVSCERFGGMDILIKRQGFGRVPPNADRSPKSEASLCRVLEKLSGLRLREKDKGQGRGESEASGTKGKDRTIIR